MAKGATLGGGRERGPVLPQVPGELCHSEPCRCMYWVPSPFEVKTPHRIARVNIALWRGGGGGLHHLKDLRKHSLNNSLGKTEKSENADS